MHFFKTFILVQIVTPSTEGTHQTIFKKEISALARLSKYNHKLEIIVTFCSYRMKCVVLSLL